MDFQNRDDLEKWLEGKPRTVATTIAARAALRVTPLLVGLFRPRDDKYDRPGLTMTAFRCTLTSSVASTRPTEEVKSAASAAADSAAFSAFSADSAAAAASAAADSAADSAAFSAASAAFALSADSAAALWKSVSRDADRFGTSDQTERLFQTPLWFGGESPEPVDTAWAEFRPLLQGYGSFDFWIRWYEGFLHGTPLNWDIQEKIALLPDEDWEQGPEHIAGKIAEIEAEFVPPPISPKALASQAQALLLHPRVTELTTEGLAVQIETSIQTYMHQAPANCLPEGLEILEQIPGTLRTVSKVAADTDASRDAQIAALEAEIATLRVQIETLTASLETARTVSERSVVYQNFLKACGLSLGFALFGTIGAAGQLVLGGEVGGHTLSTLVERYHELRQISGIDVSPTPPLPQITPQ